MPTGEPRCMRARTSRRQPFLSSVALAVVAAALVAALLRLAA